jgi:hypothetical protein
MLVAFTSICSPPFLVGMYVLDGAAVVEYLLIGRWVERTRTYPDVRTAIEELGPHVLEIYLAAVPDLISAFMLLGEHPDQLRTMPAIDHRFPLAFAAHD